MKNAPCIRSLLLALSVFFTASLPAQKLLSTKTGTTTKMTLTGIDTLTAIPGAQAPYYTYLWVFGDGKFVNGSTDSIRSHVYENRQNALFTQTGPNFTPDVAVYMTGNYSGGARPPRKGVVAPPPPDSFFQRAPTVARLPDGVSLTLGNVLNPPGPVSSVIGGADAMRLQVNQNVMPGDTMVSIISFRNPIKPTPSNVPIGGQVLLFYNSEAKPAASTTPPLLKNQLKPAPPAPPTPRFGDFKFRNSPAHYSNVNFIASGSDLAGIQQYKNVLAWDYDSLALPNVEERNVFAEFANDTSMWALYRNNQGDTLKFLAVFTAISSNPDLLGLLPDADLSRLDPAIVNLLQDSVFNDNAFFPLGGPNAPLSSKILGFNELQTPVVSAHDPNDLKLYACQCPASERRKLLGIVEFSNDGNANASRVQVTMVVPEQLDLASIEEKIDIQPAPAPLTFTVDEATRTVKWDWLALVKSAGALGFGHPDTKGHIVFSILLNETDSLEALEPMQACIIFDNLSPMCTPVVTDSMVVTKYVDAGIDAVLECEKCDGGGCWCSDYCWLLCIFGILFLILLVWWLWKRFA